MISQIILLVILVLINAFFAAVEIAYISINDIKFKSKVKEGDKKANSIMKLVNNPSSFLATIQIGITLAGFLSSAFASEAFAEELGPFLYGVFPNVSLDTWMNISIVLVTIILSFFMLVFGELIPKRIALKHDESIAYFSVNIIKIISIITKPFVILLTFITNAVSKLFGVSDSDEENITEEEIRLILDQGMNKGAIKKYEHSFIHNVLEFNDTSVSDLIIPKDKVFMLDVNLSIKETLKFLEKDGYKYSRVPLYDKDKSIIIGVLYVKDIFKNISDEDILLKDIMHESIFVSPNCFVNEAFNTMKVNKNHIAIVKDNDLYLGIISMKDVLEEIVGDIEDEYGM